MRRGFRCAAWVPVSATPVGSSVRHVRYAAWVSVPWHSLWIYGFRYRGGGLRGKEPGHGQGTEMRLRRTVTYQYSPFLSSSGQCRYRQALLKKNIYKENPLIEQRGGVLGETWWLEYYGRRPVIYVM